MWIAVKSEGEITWTAHGVGGVCATKKFVCVFEYL